MEALDFEISLTKQYLESLEKRKAELCQEDASSLTSSSSEIAVPSMFGVAKLSKDEVERFSRQMLCEDLGPLGTRKLRDSRVLVVGAGGLGSTVCLYLAAAGVGHLTIVDFDLVERSNLHRQIIHNDMRIDVPKALSAKMSCIALNPHMIIDAVLDRFDVHNAEMLTRACDVIVDASDNVAARYLINDAAVICGKPLVSGSAMRWEGQLTVYNYKGSPCYRCLFPKPPPPSSVGSCNDTGVVGPVPGAIGCLQALEVIKVIASCGEPLQGRMLLWNGLSSMFKTIKLRPRQATCECCGEASCRVIVGPLQQLQRPEYLMIPCLRPTVELPVDNHAPPGHLDAAIRSSTPFIIVDVRDTLQYDMCHIEGAVSLPLTVLRGAESSDRLRLVEEVISTKKRARDDGKEVADETTNVYVVCRRGIASSEATKLILEAQSSANSRPASFRVVNVDGGLTRYATECQPSFPNY